MTTKSDDPEEGLGMRRVLTVITLAGVLALSGCGGDRGNPDGETPDAATTAGYPVTINNCGHSITFQQPPERVFLVSNLAVPYLTGIDALSPDTVIGKVGTFPDELFTRQTATTLNKIPAPGGVRVDEEGHVHLSLEMLIREQPDLLLGYLPEGLSRARLAQVGIPVLLPPAYCDDPAQVPTNPGFDGIYRQLTMYGRVFDAHQEAAAAITDLRERVASARKSCPTSSSRTAAALFVYPGGTPPSAYGDPSMADAQMQAAGLTNVFGNVDKRNFEVSLEEILARDPDVLILFHVEGEDADIRRQFRALPGTGDLTAIRNDTVLVQRFRMSGPGTPLSVAGLEDVAERVCP